MHAADTIVPPDLPPTLAQTQHGQLLAYCDQNTSEQRRAAARYRQLAARCKGPQGDRGTRERYLEAARRASRLARTWERYTASVRVALSPLLRGEAA